jgi:predicted NBD/HSP70 family sugar kinase
MRISVFDIGGTWIKYALFDGEKLSEINYIPTEAHLGTGQMMEKVAEVLQIQLAEGSLNAVGISTRDQVDSSSGTILYDPPEVFPDYTGTCLPNLLRIALKEPHMPIAVENDANCAALAESLCGAAREYESSITMTFGTGIGGGIVLDGKIMHGCRYSAGEFGMMYLPDQNGKPVHWEQLASGQVLAENPELWHHRIAMGIASAIHIFNPPCLVLGGGLMEDTLRFTEVRKNIYTLLAPEFDHLAVIPAQLGNRAGMLGAGILAFQQLLEKGCGLP